MRQVKGLGADERIGMRGRGRYGRKVFRRYRSFLLQVAYQLKRGASVHFNRPQALFSTGSIGDMDAGFDPKRPKVRSGGVED